MVALIRINGIWIGFVWQGFGGGSWGKKAAVLALVRSQGCPNWTQLVPANSKVAPPEDTAELIRETGGASENTFKKGQKTPDREKWKSCQGWVMCSMRNASIWRGGRWRISSAQSRYFLKGAAAHGWAHTGTGTLLGWRSVWQRVGKGIFLKCMNVFFVVVVVSNYSSQ